MLLLTRSLLLLLLLRNIMNNSTFSCSSSHSVGGGARDSGSTKHLTSLSTRIGRRWQIVWQGSRLDYVLGTFRYQRRKFKFTLALSTNPVTFSLGLVSVLLSAFLLLRPSSGVYLSVCCITRVAVLFIACSSCTININNVIFLSPSLCPSTFYVLFFRLISGFFLVLLYWQFVCLRVPVPPFHRPYE